MNKKHISVLLAGCVISFFSIILRPKVDFWENTIEQIQISKTKQ